MEWPPRFVPAPDVEAWLRAAFIDEGAPFHNADHAHLTFASIGVLWTNVPLAIHGRAVAGMAELPQPQGNKWRRGRAEQQLEEWFGAQPDFLITLYAPLLATVSDRAFCAITEHELLHCGQALDEFGAPKFNQATGRPIFALRGHDVEEFVAIVRRWGVVDGNVRALADAATRAPEIAPDTILAGRTGSCGTCLTR